MALAIPIGLKTYLPKIWLWQQIDTYKLTVPKIQILYDLKVKQVEKYVKYRALYIILSVFPRNPFFYIFDLYYSNALWTKQ